MPDWNGCKTQSRQDNLPLNPITFPIFLSILFVRWLVWSRHRDRIAQPVAVARESRLTAWEQNCRPCFSPRRLQLGPPLYQPTQESWASLWLRLSNCGTPTEETLKIKSWATVWKLPVRRRAAPILSPWMRDLDQCFRLPLWMNASRPPTAPSASSTPR